MDDIGSFSILVEGVMNPAIHHPLWYKIGGFISESECDLAMTVMPEASMILPMRTLVLPLPLDASATAIGGPVTTAGPVLVSGPVMPSGTVVSPFFSRFEVDGIIVACQPHLWNISTSNPNKRRRILDIATQVFDEKLRETPLRVIALNNDLTRRIDGVNVARAIGERTGSAIVKSEPTPDSGGFHFVVGTTTPTQTFVSVNKGVSLEDLIVRVSSYHAVTAVESDTPYFQIGALLKTHFDSDLALARQYADAVVEAFAEKKE